MPDKTIQRTGTILYAIIIGFFGINHFLEGTGFQKMVPRFLPYGIFWVYVTGLALLVASVAFFTGKQVRLAGILLFLFLIIIVLTVHLPAVLRQEGDPLISIALTNMVKDTGLAAGALLVAGTAGAGSAPKLV